MEAQKWIEKLEQEGYTDVRVCPMPPNAELPEHTHDEHTIHIILEGELTVTDHEGTKTYTPGERVEFSAGTTHKARGSIDNGTMVIGVKN
jgi:quercetin dioxygenase-like cupin family protein